MGKLEQLEEEVSRLSEELQKLTKAIIAEPVPRYGELVIEPGEELDAKIDKLEALKTRLSAVLKEFCIELN